MEETHFLVNVNNDSTMDFKGAMTVKYQDMMAGGEDRRLLLKLRGGMDARIETFSLIFQKNVQVLYRRPPIQ